MNQKGSPRFAPVSTLVAVEVGYAPILLLVGIVIVIAVVAGAYYFGKLPIKPTDNNPKACTQEAKICANGSSVGRTGPNCEFSSCSIVKPIPLITAIPSSTSSAETANPDLIGANWKTYTNIKYGYSFKYPSNWVEISSDQQIVELNIGLDDTKKYYFIVGTGGRGGPPMDEIKGDNLKYGNVSFSRRTWIKDGIPFFIVALPDKPYSTGGNIEIVFPPTESDYYVKVFDQILSTFKFTN